MKQPRTLVTGATGRIGIKVIKQLKHCNHQVIALVRRSSPYINQLLPFCDQIIYGDVTDLDSLNQALVNVDYVIHLAGVVSIETKANPIINKVNVEGTKNVCIACLNQKVKRLIYCGSVHALKLPKDPNQYIYEPNRYDPTVLTDPYSISKAMAANLVLDYQQQGLDVVIALPSGVIGDDEYHLSGIGEMIKQVANHKLKIGIKGKYNFVDVGDVAKALITLIDRGVKGESYIISGGILSSKEMIKIIADELKVKPPIIYLPIPIALIGAGFIEKKAIRKGVTPFVTKHSLKILTENCNFSYQKLHLLTGYQPSDLKESLIRQVKFYLKQHASN